MKVYAAMLLAVLVPTALATFDSGGVSAVFAVAANVFFVVVPVVLAVGSVIGLLSLRRA